MLLLYFKSTRALQTHKESTKKKTKNLDVLLLAWSFPDQH